LSTHMKRIAPVLIAAGALATPAVASAATNSVDITYDPAACTASITVGLGQHLDPRLEWFQTIDDHRAGPTLTVTPYFVDSPHVEPIPLVVIRDGRPHRYWVRAVLRDDQGRRIGEGARTTELTCSPVVPPPPLVPVCVSRCAPSPRPCRVTRPRLRIWTSPSPAPHGGWVRVNVRAPQGTRAVRVVVGSHHKRFRLHRLHGRLWTVRMGTWQFGPPFPGMVRVEARARWRACGQARTVVRVVHRKQLDP
jgi:hypothetical protein